MWGEGRGNKNPQEKHTSSIKPLILELQVLLVHQPILSSIAKADLMICNNASCQHVKVNHIPVTDTAKGNVAQGKAGHSKEQSRLMPQNSCNLTTACREIPAIDLSETLLLHPSHSMGFVALTVTCSLLEMGGMSTKILKIGKEKC